MRHRDVVRGGVGRGAVRVLRGKRRLVLGLAPAGDARREEGVMRAFPGAFGVDVSRVGGSERASFLLHR
jgi:hypothetical protein